MRNRRQLRPPRLGAMAAGALVAAIAFGATGPAAASGIPATASAVAADANVVRLATDALASGPDRPAVSVDAPVRPAVSEALFASGLNQPVAIVSASDGSGRVFVVEKPGRIRVYSGAGTALGTFLTITSRVNDTGSEQGLLGLAFHPKYKTNGRFYVAYTTSSNALVIAEYRRSSTNRASTTERRLLAVPHPGQANHNGGNLAFGPDGFLYISTGDGGSAGDPPNNAQNRRVLNGKILRIAPNVTSSSPRYRIPSTNPYRTSTVYRHEIWAYGLRNTWRFSFDRSTGDLWLGDVGQNTWEEVDHARKATGGGRASNFGWRQWEGNLCFHGPCTRSGKVFPVATYRHAAGRCSITGGFVYRGSASPGWRGRYIFGDYCTGELWWIAGTATSTTGLHRIGDTTFNISAFGQDEAGELLVADLNGRVYRLHLT